MGVGVFNAAACQAWRIYLATPLELSSNGELEQLELQLRSIWSFCAGDAYTFPASQDRATDRVHVELEKHLRSRPISDDLENFWRHGVCGRHQRSGAHLPFGEEAMAPCAKSLHYSCA